MLICGAQILIKELITQGVDTIFGYPGGTIIDIYDQLLLHQEQIKHVITAHEQGAVHAADGYARASGKVGVVLATSGPGATNLVTGIAAAYMDSTPLVAITGNVATPLLGKDSFQEVDIIGVTQQIVKHSFLVRDIADLEGVIKEAFKIATSDRNGPVLIDLPKDIQQALCEYPCTQNNPAPIRKIAEEQIDYYNAVEAINHSQRPFLYCGGGVVFANAGQQVLTLAQKLHAPIGLSMMGLSAVPGSYPLNLGMTGMHGKYAATMAQSDADLLIAIGTRFSDRATGNVREFAKNCTIVHIDIDPAEINKNIHSRISLCGNLNNVLRHLTEKVDAKHNEDWIQHIENYRIDQALLEPNRQLFGPRSIIEAVQKHCTADTLIATDVGQHQMWTMQYYHFEKPRTLITSGGLGAMGFGLGAAIGASLAAGRQKTVLFTGDGSFGMNLQELATAVSEKIPLVVVVLNNGVLGMVREWQSYFYDKRYSQTTLHRATDFAQVANAFGAVGFTAACGEELNRILDESFALETPVLINCLIDPEWEVLPMIPPGGSVKNIILK